MKNLVKLLLVFAAVLLLLLLYGVYDGKNKPCAKFSYFECPPECVVCPPCETCDSLVCRTEDFCAGIGFNRSWLARK